MERGLGRDLAAARAPRDQRGRPAVGHRPDSFTRFSAYLADGGLPQPRRDHAAMAAARLDRLERAQAAYDAERALEDEFALAELRTTGEAFAGEVVSAEPPGPIISAAGRTVLRPRFTVRTSDPLRIEPGRMLICPARPSQRVQIADLTHADTETERVSSKSSREWALPASRKPGAVPPIGESVSYTLDPGLLGTTRVPARRADPLDPRRPPRRGHPLTSPSGAAVMSEDRGYDPAAETDTVIAAVLTDMAERRITAPSSSTRRPVPGRPRWWCALPLNWPPAAKSASSSPRPTTRSTTSPRGWPPSTLGLLLGRLSATDYTAPPAVLALPNVTVATRAR